MSWVVQSEESARAGGAGDEEEIIYVTQVADLIGAYESIWGENAWYLLSAEHRSEVIARARSYLEGFNEGMYSYDDALKDAVRDMVGDPKGGGDDEDV